MAKMPIASDDGEVEEIEVEEDELRSFRDTHGFNGTYSIDKCNREEETRVERYRAQKTSTRN